MMSSFRWSCAAITLSACYMSHGPRADGGTPERDGGVDAGAPVCDSPAMLERVPELRYGPIPDADSSPYLGVYRVLSDESADQFVLAIEEAAVSRAVLSLIFVGADGRVRRTTTIDRPDEPVLAFDVVTSASGWLAIGADNRNEMREMWSEVWNAAISRTEGPVIRTILERAEYGAIQALRALPRGGDEVDVYTLRDDVLVHQIVSGGVLGEAQTVAGPFPPEVMHPTAYRLLTAAREGTTTCIVITGYPSGAAWLLRLAGDEVAANDQFASRGVGFAPVPVVNGDRCAIAYFEPDVRHPTRGRVRVLGTEGGVLGWGGTHPIGLAMMPDARRVALAVQNRDWPDRVDLHVLELGDSDCRAPDATLTFPATSATYRFGSVMAGSESLLFLPGLDGEGTLTAARVLPAP